MGGNNRDVSLLLYCGLSGLFFAACAYAQSNDPDPELWILGYLFNGCLLNLFTVVMPVRTARLTDLACCVNLVVLILWITALLPNLDYSLLPDVKAFGWSVLEFEEGREIGGLLLLFLHVLKLRSFQQTAKKPNEGGPSSLSSRKTTMLSTTVAVLVILGALYMWVMYQPLMNSRLNVEHCNDAFSNTIFGRKHTMGKEEL